MKNHEFRDGCFGCFTVIVAVAITAILLVFAGTISWCLGYAGGWLLKTFIGGPVTEGLNIVLGNVCDHVFVETDIPYIMATLGLIGSCLLKGCSSGTKKKDLDEAYASLRKSALEAFDKEDSGDEENE